MRIKEQSRHSKNHNESPPMETLPVGHHLMLSDSGSVSATQNRARGRTSALCSLAWHPRRTLMDQVEFAVHFIVGGLSMDRRDVLARPHRPLGVRGP
jgi:hypothetical protein